MVQTWKMASGIDVVRRWGIVMGRNGGAAIEEAGNTAQLKLPAPKKITQSESNNKVQM